MRTVIVYPYPSVDGVYAAFAYYVLFGKPADFSMLYVPVTTLPTWEEIELLLEKLRPKDDVYFLGVSAPIDLITKVYNITLKGAMRLNVREAAMEHISVGTLFNFWIRSKKSETEFKKCSSARLAWEHFLQESDWMLPFQRIKRPFLSRRNELYHMIELIEDDELGRHELPQSKEFALGVRELGLTLSYAKNPNIFEALLALDEKEVCQRGRKLVKETCTL